MLGDKITKSSARTGQGRDDWRTPPEILDVVREFGPIGLDAATSKDNPLDAQVFYTETKDPSIAFSKMHPRNLLDGLRGPWVGVQPFPEQFVWCNPPYSKAGAWIEKAELEAKEGAEVLMFIASRTGTRYWGPAWRSTAICFVEGRVTFLDASTGLPAVDAKGKPMPAPFDSALVYWGRRQGRFRRVFSQLGQVIYPSQGGTRL